jgi:hypothetical protein
MVLVTRNAACKPRWLRPGSGGSTRIIRGLMALAGLTILVALPPQAAAAKFAHWRGHPPYAACPPARPGNAECLVIRVPTVVSTSSEAVGLAYEGSGEEGGYDASDLRSAYKLPETGGSGQTVAIVDAYNDPNA